MTNQLGIEICGERAEALEEELRSRLASRISSGDLSEVTIRSVEKTTFRPIPEGTDLAPESIERLRRLCQLWEVRLRVNEISSHRKVIGPVIVFAKRIMLRLMQFLMKDALHQQRSFNAEVIRALAEMSTQVSNQQSVRK